MTTENEFTIEEIRNPIADSSSVVGKPAEEFEVEEQHNEQADIVWPTGFKLYMNMACIFAIKFLLGLDLTIVAVCVPSLTDHFKTVADIGWYSAAYAIMVCCFNFFFGKLYALFAIKKLLIISVIIFEAGSLLCGVAPTSSAFICGRAIAGIGFSGVSAGGVLVIIHSFPNHKRPLLIGLVGGVFSLAMVSAPLIGGALIDAWSWRLCFLINLPPGVIMVASVWYNFQETTPNSDVALPLKAKVKQIDLWGTLLLFGAIATFLIALQWGGTRFSWRSPIIISLFVIALAFFASFGYLQHRAQEKAILPPKYLKNRTVLAAAWFQFCTSGTMTIVEQYLSIFFQSVKNYPAGKAGVMGVPLIVGLAIGSPIGGYAISRVGYYSLPMYVTTILSPIGAGFLSTVDLSQSNLQVLAFLGLLGFAIGFGGSSSASAIQTIFKPAEVPSALAVVNVGGTMGAAISICASAALFQSRLVHEVRQQDPNIDVAYLEHVGLTDIRQNITSDQLGRVLRGYDEAIDQTLYIPVALTVLTLVGSVAIEWRSVKQKSA